MNFVIERLVLSEKRASHRGWVVLWETVGYHATLGGACKRILDDQIAAAGQMKGLEELIEIVDGLAHKINSECTGLNKSIYRQKRRRKK